MARWRCEHQLHQLLLVPPYESVLPLQLLAFLLLLLRLLFVGSPKYQVPYYIKAQRDHNLDNYPFNKKGLLGSRWRVLAHCSPWLAGLGLGFRGWRIPCTPRSACNNWLKPSNVSPAVLSCYMGSCQNYGLFGHTLRVQVTR